MKNSGSGRPLRSRKFITVLFLLVLLLGFFSVSTALGASGGEGGSKGWLSTDTLYSIWCIGFNDCHVFYAKCSSDSKSGWGWCPCFWSYYACLDGWFI